ncbi:MAG: ArsB/NhaD family transporter [Cyanobacteriota bacterium]|nr:ArsB/NhaD family transporter [Cyanobacteriota bacterium]MDY6358699.1 ArsB/NhaD family transporter [Cyanobacteriota bacterium]MDY6364872.1 ArsB/NhaD family transporter [Cyanobacteriota bacterium]
MLNFIHAHGMLISGLILLIAYIFIASEKIQKSVVALCGAGLVMLLGLIPFEPSVNPHTHAVVKGVFEYVDFQVIFLLIGMMIIVHIASQSGVFKWLAIGLLHLTKGHPKTVMFSLAAFTAITSAFLDNVTTVVLVMPITFIIAKEFDFDPVPFLITEVLSSNIGGTATLIGDPPNIIIGTRAGLSFIAFLKELTPIVTAIFLVSIGTIVFIFRKKLKATPETMAKVASMDNSQTITNKGLMIRSVITLALVILGFLTHDKTGIPPYVFALSGAAFLLIFERPKEIYRDVEWLTIFFFVGLFIIIGAFEANGGISFLANELIKLTHGSLEWATMAILWASGILSGFIDNIPYTATMAPMISELIDPANPYAMTGHVHALWWALSLGACLGGNLTIIGAAANVLVSETANSKGYKISFLRFLKYGALVVTISLVMSSIYLYFRFIR